MFLFLGVAEIAFAKIGFSSLAFLGILTLTLFCGMAIIPARRYANVQAIVEFRVVLSADFGFHIFSARE